MVVQWMWSHCENVVPNPLASGCISISRAVCSERLQPPVTLRRISTFRLWEWNWLSHSLILIHSLSHTYTDRDSDLLITTLSHTETAGELTSVNASVVCLFVHIFDYYVQGIIWKSYMMLIVCLFLWSKRRVSCQKRYKFRHVQSQQGWTHCQTYNTILISPLIFFIMPYILIRLVFGWLTGDMLLHVTVLKLAFGCGRKPLLNQCLTVIKIDWREGSRERNEGEGYRL